MKLGAICFDGQLFPPDHEPVGALPQITQIPVSLVNQTDLDLQQQIRELAYHLYEERGRQDGRADQDWIEAEALILGKKEKLAA